MLIIAGLVGGLAIFLFGLQLTAEALQKVAGRFLRGILGFVTGNPFSGVFTGAFITVCTQSSSATTVLLVNFVQANLMKFAQTIGVILGADIGTTLTVQLIAFKITDYSLFIVAAGFLVKTLARYEREKFIGQALFGFGFIFLGMLLMKGGVEPLRSSEKFIQALIAFKENPLLTFLIATVFTAIIQSSAATIALALTLASQGLFGSAPLEVVQVSLPIIFGANIGTCATAFLASIQVGSNARRVAVAHLLIKVIGVAIFFPVYKWFSHFIVSITDIFAGTGEARMLANAHTIFNVLNMLILLPFVGALSRLVSFMMPGGAEKAEKPYTALLETPSLALAEARRRIEEMFSTVSEMVSKSISVLRNSDRRLLEDLKNMDNIVDNLHKNATIFLTKLAQGRLSREESGEEIKLLGLSHRLEGIADTVNREFLFMAQKVIDDDLSFSFEGFNEIERLHRVVCDNIELVENTFKSGDTSLLEKVVGSREEFKNLWQKSYISHIDRMHKGISESFSTGAVHFHMLLSLENINSQLINIVYLIGDRD